MDKPFILIPKLMMEKATVNEIINCNQITVRYGLMLSQDEAQELVESRAAALRQNGRVEFAGGIISKLIMKFCDSPFLSQSNYTAVLNDLIETFYYFKNETLDQVNDDELISLMKKYFDQSCQGSIDLLQNRELESFARNIRYSISAYTNLSKDDNTEESYDEQS